MSCLAEKEEKKKVNRSRTKAAAKKTAEAPAATNAHFLLQNVFYFGEERVWRQY